MNWLLFGVSGIYWKDFFHTILNWHCVGPTKIGFGHIFPPNFFLPAVFPPNFSSWQVILLGLNTPRHYFSWDFILLDFLIILPIHFSPRQWFSWQLIYLRLFPPRQSFSLNNNLPATNPLRTFFSLTSFSKVENSPGI